MHTPNKLSTRLGRLAVAAIVGQNQAMGLRSQPALRGGVGQSAAAVWGAEPEVLTVVAAWSSGAANLSKVGSVRALTKYGSSGQ